LLNTHTHQNIYALENTEQCTKPEREKQSLHWTDKKKEEEKYKECKIKIERVYTPNQTIVSKLKASFKILGHLIEILFLFLHN
jgi:hypothetical protein